MTRPLAAFASDGLEDAFEEEERLEDQLEAAAERRREAREKWAVTTAERQTELAQALGTLMFDEALHLFQGTEHASMVTAICERCRAEHRHRQTTMRLGRSGWELVP